MPDPIDPLAGPKYVLEGRLVTMGPAGVIADGAIYINNGEIEAVQPASAATPADFDSAPRVRTGDTIYPGLIELHNHLSYNAMPLWDVPRKFTNNNQWKGEPDYRRRITKPSQVLGRTGGVVEALVRFVECRSLLGGTTTSQGITLAGAGGIQSRYKGIVRNVEQTDDDALPEAGTRIANPGTGKAAEYLETLNRNTCYLQHLSEGIDDTARGWFQRLRIADDEWAVNDRLCGIHSTALGPEDLRIVAERNGSMVWSPLSNYLLYGGTVNLQAMKDSGILMGIGCDWAPSGSKNLLGELKVAWLASEEAGGVFTAQELVRMATINPARILKWDAVLGSIEAGKRADLISINGRQGDEYLCLINARETSLTLVVINGVPRVGQRRLMEPLGDGTETIRVGSSERILNFEQETQHSLVRDLKLADAVATLEDAMARLPELAETLDGAAPGLFSGSVDAAGTTWQIAFEFDEDEPDFTGAALPFADFVEPMTLDPITVADDTMYLARLMAARNLPEFIKEGLPPLYGESVPIPDVPGFARANPLLADTRDLKTFLRTSGELRPEERLAIVDQALLVLDQNYVHLPLKRSMHAVDPVQRLRLLRHRLVEEDELSEEIEFHKEMVRAFNSLRDLHTLYRLPRPYRGKVAWLPFLVEEYWESGHRRYMITKVVGGAGPDSFLPGVEVLYWNGTPISEAVVQNAEREAGSNPSARLARGLNSLTIRPLVRGLPPSEAWVSLRYRDEHGEHEYTQEWLLFEPGRGAQSLDLDELVSAATAFGLDSQTDDVQEAKRVLYAPSAALETEGAGLGMPTVFRAHPVETSSGTFGYLRIFTFNVDDSDAFVREFIRLVRDLPERGLVIDVRGNGGGHIHAAERLLQLLTPRRIEPERAQFVNTPLNLALCRKNAPSPVFADLSLEEWIGSIAESVKTGATYSLGYAVTPLDTCNDIGQKYYGPVVLITDALCYSATDMFAAGFQDHEIGKILGVHPNTGAGGANVWTQGLLRQLVGGEPYEPLPKGADLRVAIRRTVRVGKNAGGVLEDLGVKPDEEHRMTRADVLKDNWDLIEKAGRILAGSTGYGIRVRREGLRLDAETRNVAYLEVAINDRTLTSQKVEGGAVTVDLEALGVWPPLKLDLRGFDAGEDLVAAYRQQIE